MASQIGKASAIIMVCAMADKILAIGKEVLTARRFGVSASLDVYNVAYSFPGTVVTLFAAVLVSAFVPLYIEWTNRTSLQDADSHATWLIYVTAMFFLILYAICYFLSPLIIQLFGYGFNPDGKLLGVAIERLIIVLIFIDGAGILLRGVLHARKMFFHLYVAPIFVNVVTILFLIFNAKLGIYVLAWGLLIGTLLRTVYMVIALRHEGFLFKRTLPFDPQKMKAVWLLALPMLGSDLIANSNMIVDQVMATQLPAGSVSTLRYAFRINDFPIQVIITAVSRAIFPFISEYAAAGNHDNLKKVYKYSLIFLGFLTIPITCLVILFSGDIVAILLKRGAFDAVAARHTSHALACYSLGLFFYGYTFVNGSFFAALQSTKTLLYMGFVSIALNVIFNFVFMHFWGAKGIALSTSVTMCIISIWFIFLLKRRLGIFDMTEILSNIYRILFAAACMLGAGFLTLRLFKMISAGRWVYFPITGALACAVYLGVVWMFRTEDIASCLDALMRMGRKMIRRKAHS